MSDPNSNNVSLPPLPSLFSSSCYLQLVATKFKVFSEFMLQASKSQQKALIILSSLLMVEQLFSILKYLLLISPLVFCSLSFHIQPNVRMSPLTVHLIARVSHPCDVTYLIQTIHLMKILNAS